MKRRTVLLLSVSMLLSRRAKAKSWSCKVQEPFEKSRFDGDELAILNGLLSIFDSPRRAAELGNWYVQHNPEFSNAKLVMLNLGVNKASSQSDIRLFETQRSSDFKNSNTVSIDGWVLSRAEISLCCAASLIAAKA